MISFLDTSLVLDVIENNARAKMFRQESALLDATWCASPLVRMECRVRALAEARGAAMRRVEDVLAPLRLLPITDEVFERGAEVRATTGLKTPDALHVATALIHGCGEIWTADARLARVAVEGLAVRLVA